MKIIGFFIYIIILMEIYLTPRSKVNPWEVIWKITSWDSSGEFIFKGTYLDAKTYADKLYIRNPQIVPVDYKQISNMEKYKLSFITADYFENKNKSKLDIKQQEPNTNHVQINDKFSLPKLDLQKISSEKVIIDAPSARQLTLSSCNENYIRQINDKIMERAKFGYNYLVLDLDELLGTPINNKQIRVRNLISSPKSPLRTQNDMNNLSHLTNFFRNLGYEIRLDIDSLTISWF